MSAAGWYPDPGGAPGMFRYWDGTQWAPTVSPTPGPATSPLPAPGGSGPGGAPLARTPRPASGGDPLLVRPAAGNPYAGSSGFGGPQGGGRRASGLKALGWWALMLVVIGALVFGGLQLLRGIGISPFEPAAPANPTINPCPPEPLTLPTRKAQPADGRVHGGKLSYPRLSSPWTAEEYEDRLPFGRDVWVQTVTTQANYDGNGHSWVASILVGELIAGDGFFSPKEASDLIAKCAMQRFYSDALVTRNDVTNKAVTVSGKSGWLIETHLTFDIPRLKEKGETAIFVVVQTSDTSSSIYYASIPDSVPQLLTTARQVQEQLRVDP